MTNDLPLNWAHYIRETFFIAWENSTPVDLTSYLFLFEHHFDLKKINEFFDKEISEGDDPEKIERYHKKRIRILAQIFTELLLEVSDDGKHITNENIEKAKIAMEAETRCIYDC